ncbi:ribulose-phosphate 3-epimerase [Collinsella sp. AGMB00827]|uniref:Ribulose-phosphate 3-epimerase n=1 Tax=Collinsella ureilytica TaxID=2869515 RepID=A0ABS7MMU0_9ACTN|nr:ribulose-phosphate 3-epimerase [Collinsella urealyticum]MBY4798366.1 ribulose-phosphate 3-epimerase [Collinsella urealyticum]
MLLCPSMMCADFGALREETQALDAAGVDIFHCDIMDGTFVPNITMGLMDVRAIRAATNKPIDCHLMVENPSQKIDLVADAGADIIYIHPESERYMVKTLAAIRDKGLKAGLVINPDTSVHTIQEMLNFADYVMVMTVNPGFAGQQFIEFTTEKIKTLASLKERYGFVLTIDGACSPERIERLHALGADGFVLGTSALFGHGPYTEALAKLRAL